MRDNDSLVFAFDIGFASLGIAIRRGNEIIHADALLLDSNIGSMKDERARRRGYRTRQAHKRREEALQELWLAINEEPLFSDAVLKQPDGTWLDRRGDSRLKREFPAADNNTVYTSCLLRIMLLEGKALAPWQIFKALHSAIQRRGYDVHLPWKSNSGEDDESAKKTRKRMAHFNEKLKAIAKKMAHRYPCYYEAFHMGMWRNGRITAQRLDPQKQKPGRVRGYIAPRELVDEEVRKLLKQASKQLPKLKKYINSPKKMDTLLYGKMTAQSQDRRYPSGTQNNGLLAQKRPRFNNRCTGNCSLIPRFHVCKKSDELFIRVNFLLKLVHFRYFKRNLRTGELSTLGFTPEQIIQFYEEKYREWQDKRKNGAGVIECCRTFRWTALETKQKIADRVEKFLHPRHSRIEAMEHTNGRCRYSRPALIIVHELITSGEWQQPDRFYKKLIDRAQAAHKQDDQGDYWFEVSRRRFRLFKEELRFLLHMKNSHKHFYLPKISLAEKYQHDRNREDQRLEAITKLISLCRHPQVRHRIAFFNKQMELLIHQYGKPDHVCLEFVREDFMSAKRKVHYLRQSEEGRKDKQEGIRQLREEQQEISDEMIERIRLIRQQGHYCLYTGKALLLDDIDIYEVDHILPESANGPDSLYNKVITFRDFRRDIKQNRIPFEVPEIQNQWEDYLERVKSIADHKKRALLLATSLQQAQAEAEKYTSLAATAEVSRLARDIICLRLGWQPGESGVQQHVSIISGGLTNRVARKYQLYSILGGGDSNPMVKNRTDNRHHALDAMIISYVQEWARDRNKTGFFKLPEGIDGNYFAEKLKSVHPHKASRQKASLSERPQAALVWDTQQNTHKLVKRERNEQGKRVIKHSKPVAKSDITVYKNLRKDKSSGRGHWYGSRSVTNVGSRTHGCLLVYPVDKSSSKIIPLHAHSSPFKEHLKYKRQGKIAQQLRAGDLIAIRNDKKIRTITVAPATVPEKQTLAQCDYGKYRIISTHGKIYVRIAQMKGKKQFFVKVAVLSALGKKNRAKKLIVAGGSYKFATSTFLVTEQPLLGAYQWPKQEELGSNISMTCKASKKMVTVPFRELSAYMQKNHPKVIGSDVFEKNDIINIQSSIAVVLPPPAPGILPDGKYYVSGFDSGMTNIKILNNTGKPYKMQTKKCASIIVWPAISSRNIV